MKENVDENDSLDVPDMFEKDPKPVSWSTVDSWVFPEARWRINNLIPREGFVILASISGEKKTWIALEMAKSIANGSDFLGDPLFKTLEGNVLYIDAEMSKSEIQRRGRQLGLSEQKNKLFILNTDDINFQAMDSEDLWWLERFVRDNYIVTVFIDTLRAVAGGLDEVKAEKVRAFFNGFKPFKNKGVSIVFLDHQRKPAQFEGKSPKKEQLFASQDKVASVEVLLMIKSDEDGEQIEFYPRKNRMDTELRPFKIIMKDDIDSMGIKRTSLQYGGQIEEAEAVKEKAKLLIKNILNEGGKKRQEILNILEKSKIGGRNASSALRELEDSKEIGMKKEGRQNFYFLLEDETWLEKDSQQGIDDIF